MPKQAKVICEKSLSLNCDYADECDHGELHDILYDYYGDVQPLSGEPEPCTGTYFCQLYGDSIACS